MSNKKSGNEGKKPKEEKPSQQEAAELKEEPAAQPSQPTEAEADTAEGEKEKEPEEPKEPSEAEKLKKSLDELNDRYLRMLAEYDNYRRRSQKERESIYADVRADTVTKFLPVYDNLARAVQHEADGETRKGVEAILTQFKTILESLGVAEIPSVGKKFDPALHEALLHIQDEKYGEGEIVLELEKGFKLGDKVIRYAKVQVAN